MLLHFFIAMSAWSPLILTLVRSNSYSEEALSFRLPYIRQLSCCGSSPLHFATLRKDVRYLQFLLRYTSDVDQVNHYHETPLHWAVKAGHTNVVQVLLDFGAKLDLKDADDLSALDWAIEEEQHHLLSLLSASSPKELRKLSKDGPIPPSDHTNQQPEPDSP